MSCCKTIFVICNPIPACIYQLVIKTPIVSDDLTLKVIDKFNKVYYASKTADADGLITLQLREDSTDPINILEADFPTALFNEFAGGFKLLLMDSSNQETPWTISGVDYDALGIIVRDITPVVDSFTLDPTYEPGTPGDFNNDFSGDFFV
jgi:hypothetical protein